MNHSPKCKIQNYKGSRRKNKREILHDLGFSGEFLDTYQNHNLRKKRQVSST